MEHESFEDESVAALLNESFVAIKVDREERPDLDQIYMSVCQLVSGRCGWPLTVLLTPDKKPFYVATYIPRDSRYGRAGMLDLLPRIIQLWQSEREKVALTADEIVKTLTSADDVVPEDAFSRGVLDDADAQYAARFDPEYGGFSSAPKFPCPHDLLYLMERNHQGSVPAAVSTTLRRMRQGGLFDHVGWGFHRYSTDREWKLPHFEKMLYDNALLCLAFAEAAQRTSDGVYTRTVREIAGYVDRVLTAPGGAFYSAEDADSEGEEGRFYLWSADELAGVLGPHAELAAAAFGIQRDGNFRDEATGTPTGRNVLFRSEAADERLRRENPDLEKSLEAIRQKLFRHRETRPRPLLDDKILTDWNGLMIAALSRAGSVLEDDDLVGQARAASEWILANMQPAPGRLWHRSRSGEAGIEGMLDDYAFLVWGLIELHQATFEMRWLEEAKSLADAQIDRFCDDKNGGFFLTDAATPIVLHRPRDFADGALPSGNSASVYNFARLFALTGNMRYYDLATGTLEAASSYVNRYPSAFGCLLLGAEVLTGNRTEIVIVGERESREVRSMIRTVRRCASRKVVALAVDSGNRNVVGRIAPFTKPMRPGDNGAAAYVCSNFTCDLPVYSAEELERKLKMRTSTDGTTA